MNYKDGEFHGTQKGWYKNGQLAFESFSIDGIDNGLSRQWYENGQLSLEENYLNGELISSKCWDENGNLIQCDQ
jgi:antitoxin component YwqK of YwqJK toxin-antitoxin module